MKFEANVVGGIDSHFKPKVVAVIPARGGSTRLPDKNMRLFAGRPLVAWSIIQAMNSLTIDEVWVTSDSKRILELAASLGARCFERTEAESDDAPGWVPILKVCREVMRPLDVLVGLMATSPLRMPHDIDRAVSKYFSQKDRADKFLISVARIHEDYRWRIMNDECVEPLPPIDNHNCRYDGAEHVSTFAEYEHSISEQGDATFYVPYFLEEWQAIDVNSADQLRLAELIFYDKILSSGLNPYEVYRKGGLKK
jgi:CMP-N-acetylneuraminic acid synthetase